MLTLVRITSERSVKSSDARPQMLEKRSTCSCSSAWQTRLRTRGTQRSSFATSSPHTLRSVSSAIIQRYLPNVIDAALSSTSQSSLTGLALEAISFTVKQGLAHPMQCLPALVALECSGIENVTKRAFALHSSLHTKYSALINTRIAESISTAFSFQRRTSAHIGGE